MAKVLFFFTASYPYGSGETFIENEIDYLAEAFDKVVIISNNTTQEQTRKIPANSILYRLSYELTKTQKLLAYKNILTKLFWQERKIIKETYKQNITRGIINTMCQTLQKADYWYLTLSKIIKGESNNTDQIFLYSYWNNDMAFAIANYKQKHSKAKSLSRMHGWDVYFEANSLNYLPFRKYLFQQLDQVFAISQRGKAYYKNLFPVFQPKIQESRLGTKYQGKNPVNTSDCLQLLTISNTIAIKNLSTLVKALAQLDVPFHWTHFGDGDLQDEIQMEAEKLIPQKFTLKGRVPNTNILHYLATNPVDLFINVSLSEGIPVSIMEAMSFGIPCMATNVGGTSEIVDNENGVLLSSITSPEEIAGQITSFNQLGPTEKEKKRNAADKSWHEKFNAENNYTEFTKQILDL